MEDIISLKQQGEIPYMASTDIVWGSFERIRQRMRKKKQDKMVYTGLS